MRFRLFWGYLVLEVVSIILTTSLFQMAAILGLLSIHLGGFLLGAVIGILVGRRSWIYIQTYLTNRSENKDSNRADLRLLGPPPIVWTIFIYLIFYIFPNPLALTNFALVTFTVVDGILNGLIVIYFLYLSIKIFFKEKNIGEKIVLTVG